ncbi:hypothetical protein PMAYCL1PPCAC_25525, partial [Pristionchus mayeri]
MAISDLSEGDIFLRECLLPNEKCRREHSIVRVSMNEMHTTHLHPVEPTPPVPSMKEYLRETVLALSPFHRAEVYRKIFHGEPPADRQEVLTYLKDHLRFDQLEEALEALGPNTGVEPFDGRSEYLKRVWDVRTSSQRSGSIVTAVRALS